MSSSETEMTMIEYRKIRRGDLPGIIALCEAEEWPSFVQDRIGTGRFHFVSDEERGTKWSVP